MLRLDQGVFIRGVPYKTSIENLYPLDRPYPQSYGHKKVRGSTDLLSGVTRTLGRLGIVSLVSKASVRTTAGHSTRKGRQVSSGVRTDVWVGTQRPWIVESVLCYL